jgi:long-chain acyl-CoA synthetase
MTETNAFGIGIFGDDYVSHPTSTGNTANIVMDVEIRDDEGQTLGPNQHGEIWLKSPTLIRGYWRRPEDTATTIVNGWLRTGDLGRIDDEGYLYVEDRVKDMILRAGENVYSAEVEAAIYELPEVYEAAVFGVANERLGEEVACVVMLKPHVHLSEEELRARLHARLANFKVPTLVYFTPDPLPRNPAGKFLKREMQKRYSSTVE